MAFGGGGWSPKCRNLGCVDQMYHAMKAIDSTFAIVTETTSSEPKPHWGEVVKFASATAAPKNTNNRQKTITDGRRSMRSVIQVNSSPATRKAAKWKT